MEFPRLGKAFNVRHRCIGNISIQKDGVDVAEVIDAKNIHQPVRDPQWPRWNWAVLNAFPFPSIRNEATSSFNRRHCFALNARAPDEPAQPTTDHKHKDDQPPQAEAEEPSPGTQKGFGLIGHAGLTA